MKKIKLIIRVNETCNCMEGGFTVGTLTKEIEDNIFIKPILNSILSLGYYNFCINRIFQDIVKSKLILQEHTLFSQYSIRKDIEKLKKKLISKGWKWKEAEK